MLIQMELARTFSKLLQTLTSPGLLWIITLQLHYNSRNYSFENWQSSWRCLIIVYDSNNCAGAISLTGRKLSTNVAAVFRILIALNETQNFVGPQAKSKRSARSRFPLLHSRSFLSTVYLPFYFVITTQTFFDCLLPFCGVQGGLRSKRRMNDLTTRRNLPV